MRLSLRGNGQVLYFDTEVVGTPLVTIEAHDGPTMIFQRRLSRKDCQRLLGTLHALAGPAVVSGIEQADDPTDDGGEGPPDPEHPEPADLDGELGAIVRELVDERVEERLVELISERPSV